MNRELQLEVLQERDWEPRNNVENIDVTVKDGIVTLSGDLNSLFDKMAQGYADQRESRPTYPKSQYIAGLLVIHRQEGNMLPLEAPRSAFAELWTGTPVTIGHDSPEIFLSAREMEVLSLIAAGQSNQEIAERLCLALNTVKRHAYNIYAKLDAKNRTQAVSKARRLGLIS